MTTGAPRTSAGPIRRSGEDLFEHSRMSFGEHLEELRKVLVRALIGLGIGSAVGLYFGNQIIGILLTPLNRSIEKFNQNRARQEVEQDLGWVPEEFEAWFESGYIPQKIWVEPEEFALKFPSADGPNQITSSNATVQLSANEFPKEKIVQVCERMVSTGNQHRAAQAIFGRFSESDQEIVKKLSQRTSGISDADEEQFFAILNRVLDDTELRRAEALNPASSKVSWWETLLGEEDRRGLGAVAMSQALDKAADSELNRKLNRVLIHRAFKDILPPLRSNLVPLTTWREVKVSAQSLAITEPFMIWVKAGIVAGLFLSSPWVFFQIWSFVAAGLYPHEQRYVHLYLPISLGLFLSGILLAYFFVFDPVLQFLFTFNAKTGIEPQPRVSEWLGFVLFLPLGFGIAFQLPLLMLFLNRIGVIEVSTYVVNWRIAVMVIFVLAMFLTPADPISMLMLAVPLTFLYFGGVLLCYWKPRAKSPFEDDPLATSN
ncbi:MAG: twin-arginine translocase subunit TatC [Pirellulaceae bacterium]|nr:twin-arginine translocase subunit TatC [Pirellulaceae bacterium]